MEIVRQLKWFGSCLILFDYEDEKAHMYPDYEKTLVITMARSGNMFNSWKDKHECES